jgi:hypothetical protein
MSEFEFLRTFVQSKCATAGGDCDYALQSGISDGEITRLAHDQGLTIPDELREFYRFSYGALLGDYEILTIPGIVELLADAHDIYEDMWEDRVCPFANVPGVGDFVSFDLAQPSADGLLVLDCFHEVPPKRWKGICFGLRSWLIRMVESDFEQFWL